MAQPTSETESNLFEGVAEHRLSLSVLEETYAELRRLIEENGWDEEEGLRIVLTRGLAYLKGEAELSRWQIADGTVAEELDRLRRQAMEYASMYAVMKFKAFKLMEVARVLELNVTGLRGENNLCHSTLRLLRDEIAGLKAENARLKARVVESDGAMPASPPQPAPLPGAQNGFWGRLSALFNRRK